MDNNTNNQSGENFYTYGQNKNTSEGTDGESRVQDQTKNSYTSQSTGNQTENSYAGQSTGNQTENSYLNPSGRQTERTYQVTYGGQYTGNSYTGQTYGNTGTGYNGSNTYNTGYHNTYGSQGNGYGSGSYYQNNAYQGNMNYQNIAQEQPRPENKKKEKKPDGFGMKLVKCAVLALVFGMVSGVVFEGIHLVGSRTSGEVNRQETLTDNGGTGSVLSKSDSDQKVEATAVSSRYVATDVSDIVDSTMPSIVAVTNVSVTEYQSFWGGRPQQYESTSCGTGIIVSQSDEYLYIVTNNHVVEGATSLTVTFNDDASVSAEIKGTEPSTDLAVIKVSLDKIEESTMSAIKIATLGNSDELRVGQAAIAIGNALGYGQSVTTGCISALDREVSVSDASSSTNYTADLIQTDAAINPGNSGGALLNAAGEVIGINSVKYSDTDVEGIGYAIPISTAIPIIEDLITKEKVDVSESAYLGVAGADVTSDIAKTYNMPAGVCVTQVTSGSGAEMAGIQRGDIITAFDGRKISTMDELASVLEYYRAGTTVDVTIQRNSNGEYVEQVISVTLGKKY